MKCISTIAAGSAALILTAGALAGASAFRTGEPAQISGSTPATSVGWTTTPLVTIGEQGPNGEDVNLDAFGYRPPGILDGIGVFPSGDGIVRALVNHELGGSNGYVYELANGAMLRGARVSFFDIDTCTRRVVAAGPAYDTVFDRAGVEVTSAAQINEGASSNPMAGFDRYCSAIGFLKGEYGIAADVYFTGEEVSEFGATPATGMGGQQFVIDVANGVNYAVPMLGRGAWEGSTMLENYGTEKIVIAWGDDRQTAPMWLYIGEKGTVPSEGAYTPPEFLVQNGLGFGFLYVWKADNGDTTPQQFNGTGSVRAGRFVRVNNYDPSLAGLPNWDALGFASMASLDAQKVALGGFQLSRPEDLATNPADATQFVHASTGRGGLFPADNWGTTYIFDLDDADLKAKLQGDLADIAEVLCTVTILFDGDDAGGGQFPHPDFGIRSPDNVDWADDGYVYINEDRSTSPGSLFGATSGVEASVWQLDPVTGVAVRILEIDRSAVPTGQTDPVPSDIGNWESSGVLDVSEYFATAEGETVLILDVQAHSLSGGGLAAQGPQNQDLVEGGQLLLASNATAGPACAADFDCDGVVGGSDLGVLLAAWGACGGCAGDLDGNGSVDGGDLGVLLAAWGQCQ